MWLIMPFIAFEKAELLKNGDRRLYKVGGHKVLLIREDDRYYAIDNTCPHAGASLSKGRVTDACIRCPKHGIHFELASGKPRGGEAVADVAPLRCFEVVLQDDKVGIHI